MPLQTRRSLVRALLVATAPALLLFLVLSLFSSQQAQASPAAQAAPTSSIKLTWSSGVLALTELANGANGQVTVSIGQEGEWYCVAWCGWPWQEDKYRSWDVFYLTLSSGAFNSSVSTGADNNILFYPSNSQAKLRLDRTSITKLQIDLSSGASSSVIFNGVNKPDKLGQVAVKSAGTLTLNQLQASTQVTATVGTIIRGAEGINVSASTLQLYGVYGVGAAGSPLGTAANADGTGWTIAEINAYTGSIFVNNTGNLRIGISNTNGISRTNLYPGIQVLATTGNHVVDLGVTGVISAPLISDTIKAPGAITLTVGGNIEAGCMIVGTNLPFIGSINGPVRVESTNGDILLGNYRNNLRYYADITGKGVTLEAPNGSIIIDYVTYITSKGGPLNLKAKNAIRVLKTGGYSGATFYTMDVTPVNIEAPVFEMNSGGAIASSSAPMTITTDNATISATVRAPYNTLWLRPLTPGRAFDLGRGTTPNTVALNSIEVANMDASGGTVRYGGPNAGRITVTAPITRAGTARLWLDSPLTVTQVSGNLATAGRISNNNLRISALDATMNQTNTAATTTIVDGLVKLNRTNGPTLSGALVVGDGLTGTFPIATAGSARLQLMQSVQFSTTPALTVYGDGLFLLNGKQQNVGALTGGVLAGGLLSNTGSIDVSGGVLTTTHSTNTTFAGLITGTGTLVKSGLGTLTLLNDNTVRDVKILQGKVLINGRSTSTVTLEAGILGGRGWAGAVNAIGGSFQPGLSPGIFTVTTLSMAGAAELKMEIIGTTPVSQYDQLRVTGGPGADVSLLGATLTIVPSPTLALADGAGFILIDNQGAEQVSGIFNGLGEGTLLTIGGKQLAISYTGCDGNDVTLGTPPCGNPVQTGVGGIVFDAAAGSPLVGATVVMTDAASKVFTATTGVGGVYEFTTDVAVGSATLQGSYPGYATTISGTNVVADQIASAELPLRTTDLIVTKNDGVTLVNPGQVVSYTIAVHNIGMLTATNVVVTDVLPAHLTYVTDTAGVAAALTGILTRTWDLPAELAPGTGFTFTLAASVGISLPYGTTNLKNQVSVSTASPERDVTNNAASDTDQVIAYPDLNLVKSGLAATLPVSQSAPITFVLQGSNSGYAFAAGVVITDPLNTSLVTYTVNSAQLTINGIERTQIVTATNPLRFGLPALAPQDSYVLTFTGRVTNNIPIGTNVITNAATIGSSGVDGNPGDNTGTTLLPTKDGAFVYLNKTARPAAIPTQPGDRIEYTLRYGNAGNSFAENTIITDTLPANTTFVAASSPYTLDAGGTITWPIGTVSTNFSSVVTFTVQIDDPISAGARQITNTAFITAPFDLEPLDNTATAVVPVTAAPNLAIVKTNGQTTVDAGATITYTLVYRNRGSGGATGAVITDTLLANLTLVSSDPGASANPTPGVYVWNSGALTGSDSHTITVVARVSSTATVGALAANRADIADDGAGGPDPDLSDNSSADTDVIAVPFMVLGKSATGQAFAGRTITYTITYHNVGNGTAKTPVITDVVPAGTTVATISGGGSENSGIITWNLGDVAPDASGVLTFAVTVGAGVTGVSTIAPSLAIQPATGSTVVTSSVSLVSRADCAFGVPCGALRGLSQGQNGIGPADWNSNPRLSTFDSAGWLTPTAAITASTWTLPQNLAAQWVAITTTVATDASYSFYRQTFCAPLNARGLSASLDLANSSAGDIYLNGVYLGQKSGAGAATTFPATGSMQNGINLLALRVLNNAGDRNGLIFNLNTAYSGLSPFVAAPSMVQANQPVTFTVNPFALGGKEPYSYTIDFGDQGTAAYQAGASFVHTYATASTYPVKVTARDQYGCTGVDNFLVTVLAPDTVLLANRAAVGYANRAGIQYSGEAGAGAPLAVDLAVAKRATPNPAFGGDSLVFTLLVTSTGATAHNVVVQDVLPDAVDFAAATVADGNCSASNGVVTCLLTKLDDGAVSMIVLTTTVKTTARGVVSNSVTVAGDEVDPVPENNSATAQTTVFSFADLGIVKTSEPSLHVSGGVVTYTVVVTNAGPVAVSAITVTDQLPADLTRVVFEPSAGSYNEIDGSWTDIDLAAGGRLTLTIVAQAALTQTGDLVNTVAVTTSQASDPNPANNSSQDVNPRIELRLTKQGVLDLAVVAPDDRADMGDVINYTLVVSNHLPFALTNVAIVDALLGALTCTQPFTLVPGAAATCTGAYTLTQSDINAGQVLNTATGTSDQLPPQDASATILVPQSPGLALDKSGTAGPVTIGDRITYTIRVTNTGNVPLSNMRVLDARLALTKTIATLAVGQSQMYTATYGPVTESDPATITNTASVTGLTPAGLVIGPVTGTHTVAVVPQADLTVTKSSRPTRVGSGALLTYTIAITNVGPATARFVTVTEELPTGAAYVTHTMSTGIYSNTAGLWTMNTLSATKVATLTLVTRVTADSTLINVATVTSTVADPVLSNNIVTNTTPVSPTGVSGRVTDMSTQAPIVGAQVVITDGGGHVYTPTTRSGGWYTVTYRTDAPLTPGVITVTVSYPGYAAATATSTLAYGAISVVDAALRTSNLVISKVDGVTAVEPGQRITYTIAVNNLGSLTATNVVITDILPLYTQYVTDTARLTVAANPPITYAWALTNSIAPGQGFTFTLSTQVTVAVPSGKTLLTNYVRVTTASPDRDLTNNESTDTNEMIAYPDLSVSKEATATVPVSVSQPITYVLRGRNAGNSLATGITITDSLNTTLITYKAGSALLAVDGVSVTVTVTDGVPLLFGLPELWPGASYVLTFTVTMTDDIPAGTVVVTNSATIGSNQIDRDLNDNSARAIIPTESGILLYIDNVPKPSTIPTQPGDRILYTLAYGNAGNTSAPTTTVTSMLPANTAFVTGSIGVAYFPLSNTVVYELGRVGAVSTGAVTFTVQISSPAPAGTTQIVDTATITTPARVITGTEEYMTASATVGITAAPNLGIVKTDGQTTVDAGGIVTYTLTYSNAGNMAAAGVVITDTPLSNLSILTTTPPFRTPGAGYVWDIGALTVDGSHTITVVAVVTSTAPPGAVAANRAVIANDATRGVDPDLTNNNSTDVDVVARPYVVLTKHAFGSPVVGGVVTYTIAYQNMGNGAATNVVITDVIPAGSALVTESISSGGSPANGVITWTFPVAANASGVLTFAVTIQPSAPGASTTAPSLSIEPVSGSATVTSSTTLVAQPGCDFDSSCAALQGVWQGAEPVGPVDWNSNPRVVDFAATGWLTPITATTASYWLAPENLAAQWVAITTTAQSAANFSFYRQAFCTPLNADGLSASLQQANEDVGDIYLNGIYLGQQRGAGTAATFPDNGSVQNGLNLLAVRLLNNNHAAPADPIGLLFNLQADYTRLRPFVAAPTMVLVNQPVTFTADAQALGGMQPYSFTISFGDGGSAVYQDGVNFTHAYTQTGIYTATVTGRDSSGCTGADQVVVTVLPAGSKLLANHATVAYVNAAGSTYSGEAGAGILIAPDLAISKRAWPERVAAGASLTYTLLVTNIGTVANNVVLTDVLPGAVIFVSAVADHDSICSEDSVGVVRCALGSLNDGATRAITVVVGVDPAVVGVITNDATVAGDDPDPAAENNHATVQSTVTRVADLRIAKTSTPSPHTAGTGITYTIVVTNDGPSTVSAITVTDNLPNDVTGLSYSWSEGVYSSTSQAWTGLNLAAARQITLTVTGTVPVTQTGTLTNTATVTTAQASDPNPANNSSQDVNLQAAFVLTKTGLLDMAVITPAHIANVGDIIRYTLVATNTGTAPLTNVAITDPKIFALSCPTPVTLPAGAALTCTGVYTLTLGDMISLQVENLATASTDQLPPVQASSVVTVPASPALTVVKVGAPDAVTIGDTVFYTFTVQNTGNLPFTATTVSDPKLGLIQTIGALNIDESKVVTGAYGPVTEADLPGPIINTASVTAVILAAGGGVIGPMTDTYTVTVTMQPTLAITKTGTAGPATIGDLVNYTITVQNTGNVTLTAVTLNDRDVGLARNVGKLVVGQTAIVTATYGPVTERDLPGPIVNMASVTGTTPLNTQVQPVTATHTVSVTIRPNLILTETGSAGPVTIGDMVHYTVTVHNTGNVTLTNVTISDTLLGLQQNLSALAVDASYVVTGVYGPVTEDDPRPLVNTVTATGTTPIATTVGPVTGTHTVSITVSPAMTLTKLGELAISVITPATRADAGDIISYTLVATNTGNVTLHHVTITDTLLAALTCQQTTLAVRAALTCAGVYTLTQADIDAGQVLNTGWVDSDDTSPVSASYRASLSPSPSLALAKTARQTGYAAVGDVLSYTLVATNTGNVSLTGVRITDTLLSALTCTPAQGATLAPTAALACTGSYTVTQADLDAGAVINSASATGIDPQQQSTPATADATVTGVQMSTLALAKTAQQTSYAAVGDILTYTLVATNTGNVSLTGVRITDTLLAALTCTPAQGATLAPTATLACAGSYTVTQADLNAGAVVNSASATGINPQQQVAPATANATVSAQQSSSLALAKTARQTGYSAVGDVLSYTLVATNTGNVSLTGVRITDTLLSALTCTPAQGATLAPTAALTCAGSYIVTQADLDAGAVANSASATGIDPQQQVAPATANATVPAVQSPSLVLAKTARQTSYAAVGDVLNYTLVATNTGNLSLTGVRITDTLLSALTCTPAQGATLAPNATLTCAGSYSVIQADLDTGAVANSASATGIDPQQQVAPATANATVSGIQRPALALTKSAAPPTYSAVGQIIGYTYMVTNSGNVRLAGPVTVTDDKIAVVTCPDVNTAGNFDGFLDPGEALICAAGYAVTQNDLNNGAVTNVAIASMGQTNSPTAAATVTALQQPALTLVKAAAPATYSAVGQIIGYTYMVTNSGNVRLAGPMTVTDDKIAVVTCPNVNTTGNFDAFLDPSEALTCAAGYAVTQNDQNNGAVTNLASASAGGITSPPTSATVPATGAIAGAVFEDLNGNGSFDPDEPGVANVAIALLENGSTVATANTDGSGGYGFAGLLTGSRLVRRTTTAGFVGTGAVEQALNVAGGRVVHVNFGVQAQGTVAGVVFEDLNGNVVQDADEPGVANVIIELRANGATVQSSATDGNGRYRFDSVAAGSYVVNMVTPAGYVAGAADTQNVTLSSSAPAASASFGLQTQGSIGGVLYDDRNGNGRFDNGEPGVDGATVTLTSAECRMQNGECGTQVTDATGRYQFTGLAPGLYQVQATAPEMWVAQGVTGQTVNLGSGGAATASFGYQARGAVSGVVFQDLNGDATQNRGEPGLAGVAVQVLQNGIRVTSTVSGDNGGYQIPGLLPGNYLLRIVLPDRFAPTTPPEQAVALADASAVNVSFGLQPVSTIAGTVYGDLNGDGLRQNSEPGLGGVSLSIYIAGPDGIFDTGDEVKIADAVSTGDGAYQFLNQPANSYDVRAPAPAGYTATTPLNVVVNLAAFWDATANFGYQPLNTVAASAFEDLNGNGVQDPNEPPLSGLPMVVEPTGAAAQLSASSGPAPLTTDNRRLTAAYTVTTNSAGIAVFRDLPADDYLLRTALPSSSYVAARILAYIAVAPDRAVSAQFAFRQIGSVGGATYNDLDGSGQRSPGEPGLGGVVVTLVDAAQSMQTSMVTAVDGSYAFHNLPSGSFEVLAAPPAGYAATSANPVAITLAAQGMDAAATAHVGFGATGNVAGRVFADLNRNGVQDAGELGVSGVAVTLSDAASLERTLSTAIDGSFLAPNVAAGAYNAAIVVPPNFTATTPPNVPVTVDGITPTTARFGVRPNVPNRAPSIQPIPNRVFKTSDTVVIQVEARDPDDTMLLYSAASLPPGLTIDGGSGLIGGQLAADSAGIYPVTVTVSDPWGLSAQASFHLTVNTPTAIGLTDFYGLFTDGVMQVRWATSWERDTFGFHLYRGESEPFDVALRLTQELIPGKGSGGGDYVFVDITVAPNETYWYWLVEVDTSGGANRYGPMRATAAAPTVPDGMGSIFLPLVNR